MADTVQVFGHELHQVEDRASRVLYQIRPEFVAEMPAQLAQQVADSFPLRVCILAGQDAETHSKKCEKSKAYRKSLQAAHDATVEAQPVDMGVLLPHRNLSPQKRRLHRQTLKRSGRARRALATVKEQARAALNPEAVEVE